MAVDVDDSINPPQPGAIRNGVQKISTYHGSSDLTYQRVPCDRDGFVDASKYMPLDYDLCFIVVEGRRKLLSGWAVGFAWEIRALRGGEKVLAWKRSRGP